MNDGWTLVAVAAAGGVGASLRFLLDGLIRSRTRAALPFGTALINLTGSFALGLLIGVAGTNDAPAAVSVVGVGLLGGYTTFSTASVETVRLAQEGRLRTALVNAFGVLLACVALALFGIWVGSIR